MLDAAAAGEWSNLMTIEIRAYRERDWDAVCKVHDAARPDELEGSCDPRAFIPLRQDPEAEELKQSKILVAQAKDEVVAFIAWDGDYIGWLYVQPDHYRQGIGRRLLQAALARVGAHAWTIVLAGNRAAQRLYASEGFKTQHRLDSENAGYPVTCLRMVRAGE